MQIPFTFTNQPTSERASVGYNPPKGSPSRPILLWGTSLLTCLFRRQQALWALCLLLGLFAVSLTASAQSGAVFRDFNGNGTRDANEPLVSGVTVKAYLANATTPCGTATTSGTASPNYSLAGCGTAAVRVEFEIPATGNCVNSGIDFSAASGSVYGSSVQFVSGNSTNVNFGVHNPGDYNTGTTGVSVFIPCYISGDPLVSGAAANGDWFVGYPYTNSGETPKPSQMVDGSIIGATWGVAYSKQAKKVFTSALLKRHVGLGKMGSGGIYMLTPTATSFTVTEFYDLDAAATSRTRSLSTTAPAYGEGTGKSYSIAADNSTITYLGAIDPLTGKPSGLGVIGTNAQRGLTSNPLDPSYDPAAFDQVGKVGLGDIDISDDGKYLFVVNLYSRKVFRLELNDAYNPTSVASVTSYDIPATTCTNGEYRPWGLKFFRNKLYVGVVCSAENTNGVAANLTASVYELNNPTAAATFNSTALITLPLNYTKSGRYNPWTHDSDIPSSTATAVRYASPILSDIEFTDNGDMILGLMDRCGHQWGENNRRFLKSTQTSITISTSGDILLAGFNCNTGAYTLENNGTVNSANGTTLTGSSNTSEGPGGKEFFDDNASTGDPHDETATGALAVLKGQGEVVSSAFAQINTRSGDAGTMKLSTTNGAFKSYYMLYYRGNPDGILAKANGLGDIELSGIEAPIEIGNRVWNDTDSDGIQDAGETGISGVSVSLCTGAGAPIATATTDGNGNYYFSSGTGTNTGSAIYGIAGLTANTAYQVKFPTTNAGKSITTTKAGSNSAIDSDAPTTGIVAFTTGTFGANNHTFDVGYGAATCSLTATATPTACVPATNRYSVTGTISLTNNSAGGTATITDGTATTTVTIAANATTANYTLSGLTSNGASHTVTVSLPGCGTAVMTYSAPASCSVAPCALNVVVTPGTCNTATNQYSISGTVAFTSAVAGNMVITDGTKSTTVTVAASATSVAYSLTGLTSGSGSHTVVATLAGCGSDFATYNAPASCTVCSLSITTTSLPAGQVGTAYSQTLTTTGATAPLAFSVSAGSLPAGLTLNAATGVISGTPTSATTASFTVRVTDAKSCSDTQPLTIVTSVAPVCSLTATATPGVCNTATNQYTVTGTVSATNTPANQSLTISASGRSTVVTMSSNGPVSYTLTGLTSDGLTKTVSVVSSATACGSASVTFTAPASCTVAPLQLAVVVGAPVCNSATNNYTATATVSLTNATAGTLTITDNGTTIGTASVTAGQATASFSVTGISNAASHTVVASLNGTSATTTYTAPVACTVCSTSITTSSLPAGQVGTAYSQTIQTTGGTPPLTFALVGTLPTGLTLNTGTGAISGTPTSAATSSFTVKVTDAKSCSDAQPLTITTSATPVCSLTATATPGTCNTATNQYAVTGTVSVTNTPANQSLTVSVGTVSTVVTLTGNGPVSYTLAGLNSDGLTKTVTVMSSATVCGMTSVTYTAPASCTVAPLALAVLVSSPVCNSTTNNYTVTATVSLTNATAGTLIITDNGSTIGTASVTAGQASASFSVTGISNAASHTIVASLNGTSATTTYSAPVACTICSLSLTTSTLPAGQVGTAYSQTIQTTGGTAPLTFALVGTLPAGLTLNTGTGAIGGTPTSAATTSFTVKVTDSKSCSAVVALSITTSNTPVCSLTATATPGVCNTATNQYAVTGTVSATNTPANQSLTVSVGSISTVVTLTGNGPVSYTLTGLNSDGLTKTVTVVSSATACGSASVTYTAPVSCTSAPLQLAVVVGAPVCNSATNTYTATATVNLTNATAGTLTITDNGTTIGTASVTAGQATASFSVTGISNAASHTVVASLNGTSATTTYTAPVSCTVCSLSLTTSSLPAGQVGTTYSQTIQTTGGTAPLTFALVGTLPAGLTLNTGTGAIGGTPTSAATSSFTVKVTDAKNCSAVAPLTIITSSLPVCSLTATAIPTTCNTATNQYDVTGTVSATNTPANQSLTVSVGTVSTVVTLTGNGPVSYTLAGLNSDGLTKTVTVMSSATACGMTSVTYTAPASCTVAPLALAVLVSSPVCNSTTNNYTATATVSLTNATAGTLIITDNGSTIGTASVTAGQASASFSVTGISNAASHTVIASLNGTSATTTYSAPVACTICSLSLTTSTLPAGQVGTAYSQTIQTTGGTAPLTFALVGTLPAGLTLNTGTGAIGGTPTSAATSNFTILVTDAKNCSAVAPLTITTSALPVCSLTATATPTVCNSATNQYSVSGTITLTNNAAGGTVTITDGSASTTVTIAANATTANYTLSGLISNGVNHTVTVSLAGCGQATAAYTAPASCSVVPCNLVITTSTLPNGQVGTAYNQTITTTGGTAPLTFATVGTLPAGLTLNTGTGAIGGTPTSAATTSFTVKVTDSNSCSDAQPLIITTSALPVCSLRATATPTTCNSATNQYSVSGTISATNTTGNSSLTISVGSVNTVVALTGDGPASYTLTGLTSDGAAKTVTVMSSLTACGMTSVPYTAPAPCLLPAFTVEKVVNTAKAKLGDVLSYTVTVTNTSPTAGSVIVTDVITSMLAYVPASAKTSSGTYTPASGIWTISSLPASASATLTYSASVLAEGVIYNSASIDSQTATVCTSIPIQVCADSGYEFSLTVAAGQSRYQWYKDDVLIQDNGTSSTSIATGGSTPNALTVTKAGAYRVVVNDGVSGKCVDLSCCPIIVEEVSLPVDLTLTAAAPGCVGTTPQSNGQVTLVSNSTALAGLTYQYSTGGTGFNPVAAVPATATAIPANRVLLNTGTGGTTYFVRVFGPALADGSQCFADLTVVLPVADCPCPPAVCVPVTIKKSKSRGVVVP